ncbi:MAG TPA: hypothetical protein VLA37_11365, partial [Sphingomonadaceae bacterium]|nr:hypothetical protein [Sphingomonadaceae bacterium]
MTVSVTGEQLGNIGRRGKARFHVAGKPREPFASLRVDQSGTTDEESNMRKIAILSAVTAASMAFSGAALAAQSDMADGAKMDPKA